LLKSHSSTIVIVYQPKQNNYHYILFFYLFHAGFDQVKWITWSYIFCDVVDINQSECLVDAQRCTFVFCPIKSHS